MSLEEHKRRERAQAIGLFRYQLICPALDTALSTKQRGKLVREIAAGTHTDPFGNQVRISRETLDRWIRRYRAGGFEALVPESRRLAARTDAQVLELAASLKRENPTRTVAQVARILRTATGWAPSESTLLRHFHRLELMGPAAGQPPAVFGRFEAADANELWVGDALHGPRVGDRKTYLFAFLDDHSRLATGYRFGFAEDTVRLAVALKPALAARGVPAGIYVDNGSAFVDAWLLRACAKLGVRLVHSAPGRPQGRGKIERFFRTVREQFLIEVTDTASEDLAAAGVDDAAALRPALAARGVPPRSMSITARRFVDAWLLRACAKLAVRLVHSQPEDRSDAGRSNAGSARCATSSSSRSPTSAAKTSLPPGSITPLR